MRVSRYTLLVCALLAHPVIAQQTTSDVTEAQIADYKRTAETACREAGKKQGDPQAQVDAFCGCIIETLNKNLTAAEWRRAVQYSRANQIDEEKQLFAPHLKNLQACRP